MCHDSLELLLVLLYILCISCRAEEFCRKGEITLQANTSEQILTTPNFANGTYPSNMNCSILIKAPDGYRVRIRIEELEMEKQLFDHCLDYIAILNTTTPAKHTDDKLAILCGNVYDRQFVSNTNSMRLEISSDSLIENRGARTLFMAIPDNMCDPGWMEYNENCFFLVNENDGLGYVDSQRRCAEQQSNLASISSHALYNFTIAWLHNKNIEKTIWLGTNDAGYEGVFVDTNGTHDIPWSWGLSRLVDNNDMSDCVYLDMNQKNFANGEAYKLSDCRERRAAICQKRKDGTTHVSAYPEQLIRDGAYNTTSDYTLWILLLILLLLLILICLLCSRAYAKRGRNRVHTTEATPNTIGTGRNEARNSAIRQENRPRSASRPLEPAAANRVRIPEEDDNNRNTVYDGSSQPINPQPISDASNRRESDYATVDVVVPPATGVVAPPQKDIIATRAPSEKQIEQVTYVQARDKPQQMESPPSRSPPMSYRTAVPTLHSRERTSHTLQTRDESFIRAKRAADLFGRPKMDVLDNVSAISLDEFWSNAKGRKEQ